MAELIEPTKEYKVKITYTTYNNKPIMIIGTGYKNLCFGKNKAKLIIEHIDAIKKFAEE